MRTVLFFIFLIAILIPAQALAVQQQMTYLPRDEEIAHVEENYSNYVLRQTSCNVIDELSNKSSRCYACLQARQTCPDCCLRFSSDGTALASECSSALTEYTPVPALFPSKTQNPPETDTCFSEVWGLFLENPGQFCLNGQDQVPFPCQQLGCLGVQADSPETIKARPKTTSGAHCWAGHIDNGQQSWICDTDSLTDPHPDIENQDPALEYADLSCRDLGPLFDIVPVNCWGSGGGQGNQANTSQQNSGGGPGGGSCYKYSFKNDVLDCIRSCVDQAKRYSLYQKSRQCCLDVFTCSQMDPPGYPMNCSAETSCATRVDWPECALGADAELCCDNPSLTSQTCEGYQRQIQDCMDVTTGKCTSCFREFGPNGKKLTYEFFARSNERILILPQINMTPEFIRKTGTGGCP
ncbi:MAG: hypothetical protein GX606_07365, partial [Elusimicrobia bacterium]|nr:hypothetical protein [Elusimicrobiota bacterium]